MCVPSYFKITLDSFIEQVLQNIILFIECFIISLQLLKDVLSEFDRFLRVELHLLVVRPLELSLAISK